MIVDSDIMIDVLSGFAPAVEWLSNFDGEIAVSGISAIEIAFDARDSAGLKSANSLLAAPTGRMARKGRFFCGLRHGTSAIKSWDRRS